MAGPVSGGMGGVMSGVMGGVMGGGSSVMGSVMGSGSGGLPAMDKGPLAQQYEVGKMIATGGPSFVWKVFEAYRKCDGKVGHV